MDVLLYYLINTITIERRNKKGIQKETEERRGE